MVNHSDAQHCVEAVILQKKMSLIYAQYVKYMHIFGPGKNCPEKHVCLFWEMYMFVLGNTCLSCEMNMRNSYICLFWEIIEMKILRVAAIALFLPFLLH